MMWHQVATTARPWPRLRLDGSRRRLPAPAPRPALSRRRRPGPGPGSGWTDPGGPLQIRRRLPALAGLLQIRPGSRFILRETGIFTISPDDGGTDPATAPGSLPATWAGSIFPGRELPGRLPAPGASWPLPESIRPGGSGSASGVFFCLRKNHFQNHIKQRRRDGSGGLAGSIFPAAWIRPGFLQQIRRIFSEGVLYYIYNYQIPNLYRPFSAHFRRPGRELPGAGSGSGIRPRPSGPPKNFLKAGKYRFFGPSSVSAQLFRKKSANLCLTGDKPRGYTLSGTGNKPRNQRQNEGSMKQ